MMLTKHHGLGNDFLIAVEPALPLTPDHARRWCDRRRGIGADGLIALQPVTDTAGADDTAGAAEAESTPGSDHWSMTLWNSDGSPAELSGNGLRCVGQALVLHHDDGSRDRSFRIATAAGERLVVVSPDRTGATDLVTVGMGTPGQGPPASPRWEALGLAPTAQLGVDMGNPHLVAAFDDLATIDMGSVGPVIEADYAQGMNVHAVQIISDTRLELLVWERGVGLTEACGSGACAAAWAAHQWDRVGPKVEVVMPGGMGLVEIIDDEVTLTGPATFVGIIEVMH